MSQFEIIKDITTTLKELLEKEYKRAGFTTVTVSVDRPKKENIKSYPTVSCYLYHISFHPGYYKERSDILVTTTTKDGKLIEYYKDPPAILHAHYIISVFGNSASEENLLLGLTIKILLENTIIEGENLKGASFLPDDRINIFPNLSGDYNDILAFWRSLSEEVRPSLQYIVKFRIESERRTGELPRVLGKKIAYK